MATIVVVVPTVADVESEHCLEETSSDDFLLLQLPLAMKTMMAMRELLLDVAICKLPPNTTTYRPSANRGLAIADDDAFFFFFFFFFLLLIFSSYTIGCCWYYSLIGHTDAMDGWTRVGAVVTHFFLFLLRFCWHWWRWWTTIVVVHQITTSTSFLLFLFTYIAKVEQEEQQNTNKHRHQCWMYRSDMNNWILRRTHQVTGTFLKYWQCMNKLDQQMTLLNEKVNTHRQTQ